MTTTEVETDPVQEYDPVRTLVRLSAILVTIMALLAGVLIWRAQMKEDTAESWTDTPARPDADGTAVDYTFTVNGDPQQQPKAPEPAEVADFELIDRSGRKVSKKDLLGKPWVACFIFINCKGPCPRVTDQMRLLQDRFAGMPVQLVTITVDPDRDTPQRLAHYADNSGAEQDWLFLTKDQATIYPLIRDSFGLTVHEETGPNRKKGWEITHSTRVVHVGADGKIQGKYDALNEVDMAKLVSEIQKEMETLPPAVDSPISTDDDQPPVLAPLPTNEEPARG